ncbi:MAG: pyruvate dehydrogenase complex dihydrolipoamide acetyltransferase [Alphaproteobacteria bacterium]|uniref:pyruvate dehydrogenase complex dihydrolipoamide acetyltransferase n=1 Tax=Brevundimonas sp. TSRC1-1 TaxID=2804562 RepID=UPI001D272047|nr:pyruvate dehydrogenase complex dihydrolipoamide acetyltransferase [Alphaproteobacteria bacterium]MBU2030230.1 pyruvate dehydrogenase complex dihydrolipoamide acetyltransferase [Alphaproteobacteria bacterium]MBU2164522.1 pyruvate dehydrogenase complex dihydrolipoamide acetyltransferase [Alphaproteobacteria bacterium]MBU2232461.1 pyruvate dehydrogenase complex dihydrolipoamide acetyltransferase [Alphaproteobacteria bacterium]MBU2349025.1 pyruvate dehydrogenase complex dihydrolipoamide acetyltr
MTDILMPALSPTMEEGVLAKWHVKVGDVVSAGDVIAEIETDKATMEVEAVDEGEITDILVAEGTEGVKVNTPIARLKDEGGAAAPQKSEKPAAKAEEAPKAAPAAVEAPKASAPVAPAPAAPKSDSGERIFSSPLARRIAAQNGVDLKSVKGTGPHGRIVRRDVEAAGKGAAQPAAATTAAAATSGIAPRQVQSLAQMGIPDGSYDLIPLDGMKKAVARRMVDSIQNVPHFPLFIDCEIDQLMAVRAKVNKMLEPQGIKVSVNDFIIKAAALALKMVPEANASYTPEGIAMHHNADVSMAVAIDGGLITPIIRKAETKGLAQIATESKDLAKRARERKLKPEEFQGGTFSVSNLGMFGIKQFTSIINEPQGCIMSVGAGEQRAVVKNGQIVPATVMTVTLTCDHRVVDGATGARFLQAFKPLIEDPVAMLA